MLDLLVADSTVSAVWVDTEEEDGLIMGPERWELGARRWTLWGSPRDFWPLGAAKAVVARRALTRAN